MAAVQLMGVCLRSSQGDSLRQFFNGGVVLVPTLAKTTVAAPRLNHFYFLRYSPSLSDTAKF